MIMPVATSSLKNNGDAPLLDRKVMQKEYRVSMLKLRTAAPTISAVTLPKCLMFPGIPKDWSYTFMVNTEDASTGRPAGAIGWAGLANSYYWIDRKNGIGGYWATQILPFADGVSFPGYMDFESAVYAALSGQ